MAYSHHHQHEHIHFDQAFLSSGKGIRAVKISFIGLIIIGLIQAVITYYSQSAALLADTFHNFVDAFSAIPLWVAFQFARRKPTSKFTYGYNRMEDLAGLLILLFIFGTAFSVGYDSIVKMRSNFAPSHLPWVMVGAVIGFLGNEWIARYRIRVGQEIRSEALVIDGQHARVDGFTSLAVLIGALGVYWGYPQADPIIGMIIAVLIFQVGWSGGRKMIIRLMDAIPPETVNEIHAEVAGVAGVLDVVEIKARQVGQQLRADLTIEVKGDISVFEGHEIAVRVQQALQKKFPHIISPGIHVDPQGHRGEEHHFHTHL